MISAEDSQPDRKATKKEWIGLAALALPCLIYSMDLTVLNLAIPAITRDLKPTSAQLLWIVDIYGFLVAGTLITMGILGDRIGRRKILLWGATAFGILSIFAASVKTAEMLIFARALLGISAATLAPSTLSLIRNMFHNEKERRFAIGVWAASFATGSVMGPVIGGVILAFFDWGAVFLVAVPTMVALLIAGPIVLPEFRDPNAGKMDIPSAALSLATVLPVIFGMKKIATHGLEAISILPIIFGVLVGYAFVRRQRTLADPMLDLSLLKNSRFSTSLVVNIVCVFVSLGMFLLAGQFLQLVVGLDPLQAAFWMAPPGLLIIAGSLLTPRAMQFISARTILVGGLFSSTAGFVVLTFLGDNPNPIILMLGSSLYCLGLGPMGTVTSDLILSSAPPERAGVASAMSETAAEFGGALGIAVLGTFVTGFYRSHVAEGTAGTGIPLSSVQEAQQSIGGAIEAAGNLAGAQGQILASVAQDAFSKSMSYTAILCGVISIVCALMVRVVFNSKIEGKGK